MPQATKPHATNAATPLSNRSFNASRDELMKLSLEGLQSHAQANCYAAGLLTVNAR
jgi:hypothetical protein